MRLKIIVRRLLIAMILVLTAFGLNRIFLPCYQDVFRESVQVEITPAEAHNPNALSNNVRIAEIEVDGQAIDLSKIQMENGWEYSEVDDFLYIYGAMKSSSIMLDLEDVTTLKLTFISEVGSGIVNISINGLHWKSVDLYQNSDWNETEVIYDTSVFVHPEMHYQLYLAAYLITLLLLYVLQLLHRWKLHRFLVGFSIDMLYNGMLAAVLYLFLCFIQYQNMDRLLQFFSNGYLIVLESYLLVLLLLTALFYILRSRWLSFAILSIALEGLLTVSSVKISTRGLPLLPWDLAIADTALSVAGNYQISIPAICIVILLATVVLTLVLIHLRYGKRHFHLLRYLTAGVLSCSLLCFYMQTTVVSGTSHTNGNRVYQVGEYYEKNGFLLSFLEYTRYLRPLDPPDGYDKATMEQVREIVADSASPDSQDHSKKDLPNIIVVMSESFWDITRLEGVTFRYDPLPNYHMLARECDSGTLLSHVYGGNTVISEFEFLTGFHGAFFPTDYMVYGKQLRDQFFSAVDVLSCQGYHTIGMHPYIGTNYNRNVAYDHFGFDQSIFEDNFSEDDLRIRGYISDEAMFKRIEREYESLQEHSDKPLFLFGITMQNHGGYWDSSLYEPAQVKFQAPGYQDTTIACMNDYFAGLHASDEALGHLIDYFEKEDEDTIIIFFGDHMADAGTKEEKMLEKQSWYHEKTFSTDYDMHLVPYLVWSNYDLEIDLEPCMDIGLLLPSVLSETDISLPGFWSYLANSRKTLPAFNKAIAVMPDGSVIDREKISEEQQNIVDIYRLLSYDYVWGEQYVPDLWDLQ